MKKFLLISALLFAACSTQTTNLQTAAQIDDKEYKITKIIDKLNGKTYENLSGISISFSQNQFGLFVGCNNIFGETKAIKNGVEFINTASTKMLCPAQVMELEDMVLRNLTKLNRTDIGLENKYIEFIFDDTASK